jgi:hypothetical protein
MWWYILGQDKELMKAQMQQLGGPLTWVAMHVLFALILVQNLPSFFLFFCLFLHENKAKCPLSVMTLWAAAKHGLHHSAM